MGCIVDQKMAGGPSSDKLYSPPIGMLFLFNLIVGTGALAMPKAFAACGWLLGIIAIAIIAVFSFLTASLVIEAMAATNAIFRWRAFQKLRKSDYWSEDDDTDYGNKSDKKPLLSATHDLIFDESNPSALFDITSKVELGQMASLLFNRVGVNLFYVSIIVYLFGDLTIYAVAIPKTLRDVACTYQNTSSNQSITNVTTVAYMTSTQMPSPSACSNSTATLSDSLPCWETWPSLSRLNAYRLFLAAFAVLIGPFMFFNMKQTVLLQIATSLVRWIAFITMIAIACIRMSAGASVRPSAASFDGLPTLFGVCIYAFMCHHSLPGLLTPISNKRHLLKLVSADMLLIFGFYVLLSTTAVFSFSAPSELYTLNFRPGLSAETPTVVGYFLVLFPVFTLSTNFPIIGITLRENLIVLLERLLQGDAHGGGASPLLQLPRAGSVGGSFRSYSTNSVGEAAPGGGAAEPTLSIVRVRVSPLSQRIIKRITIPLLTLLPPLAIALFTQDVDLLVSITGSYAGASIQYVIPVALVYCARRRLPFVFATDHQLIGLQKHASPFRGNVWLLMVLLWTLVCVVLVTYHLVVSRAC